MSRQPGGLAGALAEQVDGEVRFDAGLRRARAVAGHHRGVPLAQLLAGQAGLGDR